MPKTDLAVTEEEILFVIFGKELIVNVGFVMKIILGLFIVLLNANSLFSQGSGNVLSFNGTNRYINLGTNVGTGVRTIEFWFKPEQTIDNSINDAIGLITRDYDNGNGANLNEFGFWFNPGWSGTSGSLNFMRRVGSSYYSVQSNQSVWEAGHWYHAAGVIDPVSGMKMYINGVLQSNTNPTVQAVQSQTGSASDMVAIGTWGYWGVTSGTRFFEGEIDEVRFWDNARSQTQIREKMCSKLMGNESGLRLYYEFNNASGNTLTDSGPFGSNGTLINFPSATNPWHYSSAPIGDTSVYIYPGSFSGISLNLQYATGDNFSINSITGNSAGAHIYRENSLPNSTLGLNTNANSNYYGVFLTGTNGGYNFDYNTAYLSNCSSNCTKIFNRNDNDNLAWLELNTTTNTCVHSKQNESGNENSFREEYIVSSSSISFDLGNDTSICGGSNLMLAPSIVGVSYLWSTGETSSSINVSSSGTYWLQLSDGSCSGRDTIIVDFINTTDFYLGNDTSICEGEGLQLFGPNGYSYLWNTNNNQQSINVTSSGVYWLEASINGCSEKDSILVVVNPNPTLNLGNDTTLCNTASYTLDGTTVNCSYLWNDNTTNATNLITLTGEYHLEITNIYDCIDQDTINITFSTYPTLDLGADISLCESEMLSLNSGYLPPYACLWSTNSQAHSIQVINSGLYWAEVNNNGCSTRDSIEVDFKPLPELNLGSDIVICGGNNYVITAETNGSQLQWNNGAISPSITVSSSNVYWASAYLNNCEYTDSIHVNFEGAVEVQLPDDTTICAGTSLQLNYISSATSPSVLWSNGFSSESISVNSPSLYWIELNENGCVGRDSILITVQSLPVIPANDTIICRGESLILDAGEENNNFLWNTGDTISSIIIFNPGLYSVAVTKNGCIKNQEINVSSFDASDSIVTISACNKESVILRVPVYERFEYNWNTDETTPAIEVSENGVYQVIITSDNCFAQKTFTVEGLEYSGGVFVPNAFTPNDDYINQTFFIEAEIITKYKLEIYNKWGENIYVSEEIKEGWNGIYKNQLVKNDTYIYILTYEEVCDQGTVKQKKGIINLIR